WRCDCGFGFATAFGGCCNCRCGNFGNASSSRGDRRSGECFGFAPAFGGCCRGGNFGNASSSRGDRCSGECFGFAPAFGGCRCSGNRGGRGRFGTAAFRGCCCRRGSHR